MSSGALSLGRCCWLEGDAPQLHRDRRSCTQDPPRLHLTYLFILLFIWIPTISFNKLIKCFLDFVSCLSKLTKRGATWEPLICSQIRQKLWLMGTYCLRLACKSGERRRGAAVSWAEHNLWDLMCSNSIRVYLLCRIPNWCHRIAWCWCGKTHI